MPTSVLLVGDDVGDKSGGATLGRDPPRAVNLLHVGSTLDQFGHPSEPRAACEAPIMDGDEAPRPPRYDWFGWSVDAVPADVAAGRLAETHEYFHRQLDDTTAFGGLTTTVAALADALPNGHWPQLRDRLQAMSDLVHESFAVGLSLLTTQRRIHAIAGYPAYDRHVRTVARLLGEDRHPWVALAALRAAATACMQSPALARAADGGIERFDPGAIAPLERPNHRLAALLVGGFRDRVAAADHAARMKHGRETWWQPRGEVLLVPEAMDGAAAEASGELHRRLLGEAGAILASIGGSLVTEAEYHPDLRSLLAQAQAIAPAGLTRIGALVEAPGGELLHGGALDSQTVRLTAAPNRAVVLPYGKASGLSGEGESAHGFVVVTRPERIRAAHERIAGVELPDGPVAAFLRSTVYDGERRDCVLHIAIDDPEQLNDDVPVFVSVHSSAAAADTAAAERWMRWADPDRLSLVMDTPSTAALRRWCAGGAQFRTQTRLIRVEGMEVRVIAGRVEQKGGRSALVIIPTTEFGARWFQAACAEDPELDQAVLEDPSFFESEEGHLDVVLNHLLFEERYVGTGSWRR